MVGVLFACLILELRIDSLKGWLGFPVISVHKYDQKQGQFVM